MISTMIVNRGILIKHFIHDILTGLYGWVGQQSTIKAVLSDENVPCGFVSGIDFPSTFLLSCVGWVGKI